MGNYVMTNADTDSISFRKPDGSEFSKEEQVKILQDLKTIMPNMIEYEDDGYYSRVLVLKAKNYVLKKHGETKLKYKGSGIKDQKKEVALREMLDTLIADIIDTDGVNVVDIYHKYIKEACSIKDISRWTTKKSISKAIFNSTRKNETKILDAVTHLNPREGEKYHLYVAVDGEIQEVKKGVPTFLKDGTPKMIPNEILKVSSDWSGDEFKEHYVKRVYSTISILKNIIDMDKIVKYNNKSNLGKLKQLLKEE